MVSGGQFLSPRETDSPTHGREAKEGSYIGCMCKCVETKSEALDGVKPSWCHYSSDRHFLSLNLSSERRRDKYTAEFETSHINMAIIKCIWCAIWISRLRDQNNSVGQGLYVAACPQVTGRVQHLKTFLVVAEAKFNL